MEGASQGPEQHSSRPGDQEHVQELRRHVVGPGSGHLAREQSSQEVSPKSTRKESGRGEAMAGGLSEVQRRRLEGAKASRGR